MVFAIGSVEDSRKKDRNEGAAESKSGIHQDRSGVNSQNEEVNSEKVEMAVDPAEEATETFCFLHDRGIQRRHEDALG